MANFKYKARDRFSKLVTGTTVADNKDNAAKKLRDMGYTPVSIAEAHDSKVDKVFKKFKRVKLEELSVFTRQLYSLQKAGLALLASLEAISLQIKNQYFKFVIQEIARDIKGGSSFSGALSKHSKVFDEVYVSMIKVAETGGMMAEVLLRLTELIEQEINTSAQIKAAVRYPLIAFSVLCLGFLIVIVFVIPRFAAVYGRFNTALPLPTRIMISINSAITNYWFISILAVGAAIFGFVRFIKSNIGRPKWDNFKLNIFLIGPLLTMLTMSRFARVTAILMKSGVAILEILALAANASGNVIIARAIENIGKSVSQGKGMSEPMKASGLFPPVVIQMVATGEQTGNIDSLLLGVADYYDREAAYMIKNLTTYIEPVLIMVLAVMVLGMALGIFLPMWNLIKVFKPH
ncbi:type II secretion system F family protein [Candidatus Omnitrophota bacterium]